MYYISYLSRTGWLLVHCVVSIRRDTYLHSIGMCLFTALVSLSCTWFPSPLVVAVVRFAGAFMLSSIIVALYAPHLTLIDEAGCCVRLFVADYCIHISAVSFILCVLCIWCYCIKVTSSGGFNSAVGNPDVEGLYCWCSGLKMCRCCLLCVQSCICGNWCGGIVYWSSMN